MMIPPRKAKASNRPMNNPQRFCGIQRKSTLQPGDHPIDRDTALIAQKIANGFIPEERPKPILAAVAPMAPRNMSSFGLYRSPR